MTADEYREVGRNPDGSIMTRVLILHWIARAFAVQFKVGGWPYGASYQRAINHEPRRRGVRGLVKSSAS